MTPTKRRKDWNGSNKPSSEITRWQDLGLGKILPSDLDAEEAVLGAMILEREAIGVAVERLKPQHFYKEAHQRIFSACLTLFNESRPIDLLTVRNQLSATAELEYAGGLTYLLELTGRVNSSAHIEAHALLIIQKYLSRQLVMLGERARKEGFEENRDIFELMDSVQQELFALCEANVKKNVEPIPKLLIAAIKALEVRMKATDGLTGVASGFTELDRITSGWQKTELIIVAARPAMGKTSFVVSLMRNAAIIFGVPVAIFSLEMSAGQLMDRLISAEAEVDADKIKNGTITHQEMASIHAKTNRLYNAPIFIDDTPALSMLELRAKCRRLKSQHGIGLIVIDYLQLLSAGDQHKGNREQEISHISRSLKAMAKELDVPVIALSQLSRSVESRADKRPQLSDLRESGAIEQDADIVTFLYRPEYYGIMQTENGNPTAGLAEVIIAKNRSGNLNTVELKFIGKYTKFQDKDDLHPSGNKENLTFGANYTNANDAIKGFESNTAIGNDQRDVNF